MIVVASSVRRPHCRLVHGRKPAHTRHLARKSNAPSKVSIRTCTIRDPVEKMSLRSSCQPSVSLAAARPLLLGRIVAVKENWLISAYIFCCRREAPRGTTRHGTTLRGYFSRAPIVRVHNRVHTCTHIEPQYASNLAAWAMDSNLIRFLFLHCLNTHNRLLFSEMTSRRPPSPVWPEKTYAVSHGV
jgi:hypothetical protein